MGCRSGRGIIYEQSQRLPRAHFAKGNDDGERKASERSSAAPSGCTELRGVCRQKRGAGCDGQVLRACARKPAEDGSVEGRQKAKAAASGPGLSRQTFCAPSEGHPDTQRGKHSKRKQQVVDFGIQQPKRLHILRQRRRALMRHRIAARPENELRRFLLAGLWQFVHGVWLGLAVCSFHVVRRSWCPATASPYGLSEPWLDRFAVECMLNQLPRNRLALVYPGHRGIRVSQRPGWKPSGTQLGSSHGSGSLHCITFNMMRPSALSVTVCEHFCSQSKAVLAFRGPASAAAVSYRCVTQGQGAPRTQFCWRRPRFKADVFYDPRPYPYPHVPRLFCVLA